MIQRVQIPLTVSILQVKAEKAAEAKREKLGQDNSSLSLLGEWQMVLHQIILLFLIVLHVIVLYDDYSKIYLFQNNNKKRCSTLV